MSIKKFFDWLLMYFAFRTVVIKDQWLRSTLLYASTLMNNPTHKGECVYADFLQNRASKETREHVSKQISSELSKIARSKDRVLACREWIDRIVSVYAGLRVIFLSINEESSEMVHPCVEGLYEHIEAIIQEEFYDAYRQTGGLEEAKQVGKLELQRADFDLRIANYARVLLGDHLEKNDWFRPFFNAAAALMEDTYREKLNLPRVCNTMAIHKEFLVLRTNVLSGYKNPLEGVEFAKREENDLS